VALSTCPECRKEISDKAWNCPHCGWHKSRAGLVAAWVVAIAVIGVAVLFYWQVKQADEASANLQRELNKSEAMIKAPFR
jgi:hypothetical protein